MSDKIETIDVGKVDWNKTAVQYMELNKQKTEAIKRVREIHRPVSEEGAPTKCLEDWFWYPCPTIKALDGEQS
jgi:hypothetical protein